MCYIGKKIDLGLEDLFLFSVIDINNDGNMDIYICSSHSPDKEKRKSLLFINDGKLHFTEQAAAYGLADTGFSSQAAFLITIRMATLICTC